MNKLNFFIFFFIALSSFTVSADEFSSPPLMHSQSDFGGTGLLQMPSARMMQEGELSGGIMSNDDYIHYFVSLQLFPWLETTVRYTQVHDMLYSNNSSFSGNTKYTDKSIDAKLRLLEESYWIPEVSLGFRDFGGTGLFDGEYLTFSKNIYSSHRSSNYNLGELDLTLGIGWGYIGNRANFMGNNEQSRDCERKTNSVGNGGLVNFERMFSGCSALFGGLEYQTPYAPLSFKLEYDGNNYQSDLPAIRGKNPMRVDTPWNVGMVYALTDWVNIQLSYERGNTLTAGITMHTNLSSLYQEWNDSPRPQFSLNKVNAAQPELSESEWEALAQDLEHIAGYKHPIIRQDQKIISIEAEQYKYRDRDEAHHRAALLLANAGIDANTYRIIETVNNQALTETRIDAKRFAQVANNDYPNAHINDARTEGNPVPLTGEIKAHKQQHWEFNLSPVLQQSLGGSENFYLYAIGVNASAKAQIGDHWLLSSNLYGNLINNYDKYNYTVPPDGTDLKRVRTLSRQYYDDVLRLNTLQLTYFDRISKNWYGQAYGGYLESMFAGIGSEVIYRPLNKNWAVGFDANYVKQRDPNSIFGLYQQETHYDSQIEQNYRVQTGTLTGHATFYWQPQFWSLFDNSLLKVSAGQYLTEDVGATIDFSKQFASGVIAGAYVAKTDLSAEEFGEGSFTKGFYISIPLDLMTIKPSTSRIGVSWLPIQRDGGQMLNRQHHLYNMTDPRSPWLSKPAVYQ